MIKYASEIKEGDTLLHPARGPILVRSDAVQCKYRGGGPGVRIKLVGYPTYVMRGDPQVHIADDPTDAWNEYAKLKPLAPRETNE